jgi:hypothetical protein
VPRRPEGNSNVIWLLPNGTLYIVTPFRFNL